MAPGFPSTIITAYIYNIKLITLTCVTLGRAVLPTYQGFFFAIYGFASFTIVTAFWSSLKWIPWPNQDAASDEEAGSEDGYDGDSEGTGSIYPDDNWDIRPDPVDFDKLDDEGRKKFIQDASTSSYRWGPIFPMPQETAEWLPGALAARVERHRVLPGEDFSHINDNNVEGDDVALTRNPATSGENNIPLGLRMDRKESSFSPPHHLHISYNAEPEPVTNTDVEKHDKRVTKAKSLAKAGPTVTLDDEARASQDWSDHDATMSLVPSTESTDVNDRIACEESELQELLGSVTKDVRAAGPLRLKHDGPRTRFSLRLPNLYQHSASYLEGTGDSNLTPKPLKLRSNTQDSEEAPEETMTALEFLKDYEEDDRHSEAARAPIANESSHTTLAKDQGKATSTSHFKKLKRIASAQFTKGSKGSKQDTDDEVVSPVSSRIISGKSSSYNVVDRDGSMESSMQTESLLSSQPGSEHRSTILSAGNELEAMAIPYGTGYTLTSGSEPTLTPPPKSIKRKPLLSVNTKDARHGVVNPFLDSLEIAATTSELSSAIYQGFNENFNDVGNSQTAKPTSLKTSEWSIGPDSGKDKGKPFSSKENPPGIFSPAPAKTKSERFTNNSPEVKMLERMYLVENFGVTSTKQLLAEDDKKPSGLRALFSRHNSAPVSTIQAQMWPAAGSTTTFAAAVHEGDTTAIAQKTASTTTLCSPRSSLISVKPNGRDRGYSSSSKARTGSVNVFSQPTNSASNVISATFPAAEASTRVRRKAVGSGNLTGGSFSEAVISPTRAESGASDVFVASSGIGLADSPTHLHYNGHVYTRSQFGSGPFPMEAFPNPDEGSFINPGGPNHSKTSSFNEGGMSLADTPFSSKTSSFNAVSVTPSSISHDSSTATEVLRGSEVSAMVPSITNSIHGACKQSGDASNPCNRLKLEEEAVEKVADKKLAKEDTVAYHIKELRKGTGTELVPYSAADLHPCHRNHRYTFDQKNLMCGKCQGNCAVCATPCCAYKGALQTAIAQKGTEVGSAASELARSIGRWFSEGRDVDTFYRCTECMKWVCPKCIGICPIYPCGDSVCAACNPGRLWEPCEYHDRSDLVVSENIKHDPETYQQITNRSDFEWFTG